MGQMDLVGGIGKQQLLPCGVALCCLWGNPCIWTKWPQPKASSKEQEKGCHGKGCFSGGRLQRHQHLQHSTSCASPAAHCSEQWLDWSNSCFPEHSQCPVCRASGWHRVFPDSSAHFSAELEILLVLYLKYVQLTWSDLIILWWCLAIPDSPTVLGADNQTTDSSEELTAESLGPLQISLEGLPEMSSPSPDAALSWAAFLNLLLGGDSFKPLPLLGKTFHLLFHQAFIFQLSPLSPQ